MKRSLDNSRLTDLYNVDYIYIYTHTYESLGTLVKIIVKEPFSASPWSFERLPISYDISERSNRARRMVFTSLPVTLVVAHANYTKFVTEFRYKQGNQL